MYLNTVLVHVGTVCRGVSALLAADSSSLASLEHYKLLRLYEIG